MRKSKFDVKTQRNYQRIRIVGMRSSVFSETTCGTSENKTASFKLDAF